MRFSSWWPRSLLSRLLVAYLIPALGLLAIFAAAVQRQTSTALEEGLGRRLVGLAQMAAVTMRAESLLFLGAGDDESRTAQRLRHRLIELMKQVRVKRMWVINRDRQLIIDTDASTRIGDRYYLAEIDQHELTQVFSGKATSSVLFAGQDGSWYKTGYAPIWDGDEIVAAIGVAGSAEYFESLRAQRFYLIALVGGFAILLVSITVFVARWLTRPLRRLAIAAAEIGSGHWSSVTSLNATSEKTSLAPQEVVLLARTMNDMCTDLQQRDQQLQMMLAGIAHEVRNPLGGMALFVGLLRQELSHNSDQLQMVQRIERELDYLKRVVEEFLSFARSQPLQLERVSAAELIEEVMGLCQCDLSDVHLVQRITSPALTMHVDRQQFRRVLLNVLRNAIGAAKARLDPSRDGTDPDIEVAVFEEGCDTVIEVKDTGIGMDADTVARVFEPFFTTRQQGTGLGMPLCKKIIEQHGGKIDVRSQLNCGTTVCIRIPN